MNHSVLCRNLSDRDSLVVNIDGIRFSLFYYPYRLIEPVLSNTDLKVSLASLMDIAAMKSVAIVQRRTAKDFVDLKAIIEAAAIPLNLLIRATLKKYNRGKIILTISEEGLCILMRQKWSLKALSFLTEPSRNQLCRKTVEDIRTFLQACH